MEAGAGPPDWNRGVLGLVVLSPYSSSMAPVPTATPLLFVNGAPSGDLTRNLESLCVHVVDGQASAEVVLVGPAGDALAKAAAMETTNLAIWLCGEEECFSGPLGEIESRILPDGSHRTVLFASGAAPDGSELPRVPLRFGAEVESGSVRRRAQTSTAHVVSNALTLRWNSRISLATPDPTFDGPFQVVELWYRFDVVSGAKLEFIGTG